VLQQKFNSSASPATFIGAGIKLFLYLTMNFPYSSLLTSELSWNDMVLDNETMRQVNEIKTWLKESTSVKPGSVLKKKLKSGYRCLFSGPPGSGKKTTAALIGKEFKKDVYKIDLSMVISKYIGETEKNLELLFARAEDKGWILFFDEADALFGKRTNVRDAHDKYANQEISYLLQRIEDYNGLVILATNLKSNIDEAFTRRFQLKLEFPFFASQKRK
jgi:SpoVK/Ycf46/Vps4 family AAA+-type ATPase